MGIIFCERISTLVLNSKNLFLVWTDCCFLFYHTWAFRWITKTKM